MAKPETFERDKAQITVIVGGLAYEGWLSSEVERSLESIAGTFSIPVSLVPGVFPKINRQDAVQVKIGSTTVIDGYVLAAEPFYRKNDCGLRIVGRDRAGDLVRCSAIHKGGQWRGAKLDTIVKDILKPFGLSLTVEADLGTAIADFKLSHGETALDAIARAAKLRGILATRSESGGLLLTKAGTKRFKGAIVRGLNVIEMQGIGTDEQRHSDYFVYGQSNTVSDFELARGLKATAKDAEMKRYLPLIINADGNTTAQELKDLAQHTMRVRRGHSMGIRYTVEGWTFEGEAWPLNQRVAIYDDIAGLDGVEWLIASVKHTCDLKEGDVTELLVRPIEAYDTAPLKSKAVRRNWGNKGNTTNHGKGPHDKARGG
jgi:prophage tail gpP-like protein